MDWTHNERRLSFKKHHRGKIGGEKDKRKAKNDAVGLGDGEERLQKNEGDGSKARRMAPLDIQTCLRADISAYIQLDKLIKIKIHREQVV